MFTYLIKPEENYPSRLVGVSVKGDTITAYITKEFRNPPSEINIPGLGTLRYRLSAHPSDSSHRSINTTSTDICVEEYKQRAPITYRYREDHDHHLFHSITEEQDIIHYHLRHHKKIGSAELKKLLNALSKCKEDHKTNVVTEAVAAEIVKEFKKYTDQRLTNYTASNNDDYGKRVPMPNLHQHMFCILSLAPDPNFCPPSNELVVDQAFHQHFPGIIAAALACKMLVSCCSSTFFSNKNKLTPSHGVDKNQAPKPQVMQKEGRRKAR